MPRWRRRVVAAALGLFVVLSAAHAVTGREHWPFSPYAMYSTPKADDRSDKLIVVAVDTDGRERWLLRAAELAPLNRARIGAALRRAEAADRRRAAAAGGAALPPGVGDPPAAEPTPAAPPGSRLHAAFADVASVLAPRHPQAQSFRLYHAVWELRPDAANLRNPERWLRLAEVPGPSPAPAPAPAGAAP